MHVPPFTSLFLMCQQDGIKLIQQQRDHTLVQHPLSQIQEQATRTALLVLPTSPNPPPHTNISDLQKSSCDLHTPNPNTDPQSAILPQLRGPVEESDEQIEKLLEDIMMGLNILPSVNLERDCNTPQHLQHNHDGAPATCRPLIPDHEARQTGMQAAVASIHNHNGAPATYQPPIPGREARQTGTQAAVISVHCVCCHGYATGSDDTSPTDTGIQICFVFFDAHFYVIV